MRRIKLPHDRSPRFAQLSWPQRRRDVGAVGNGDGSLRGSLRGSTSWGHTPRNRLVAQWRCGESLLNHSQADSVERVVEAWRDWCVGFDREAAGAVVMRRPSLT